MNPLVVVRSIAKLREKVEPFRRSGQRVGFVPTMGALHDGHLSLVQQSTASCDCTIVSIFVNPTQFAPGEDLATYPSTIQEDCDRLEVEGVDYVFIPENDEIYPLGYSTTVSPPDVASVLEGESRPKHFAGVCTVVLKLFNIVSPQIAFFGRKDYQQVAVIKQMVSDLNLDIAIGVCPIIRETDGLAMSSRNRFLSESERQIGLSLNATIQFACDEIHSGETDGHVLMAEMRQRLIDAGTTSVDYAVVCDPVTLQVMDQLKVPAVILVAAKVGKTRLIDNGLVE